ncbi:unnamed protein product [Rhizophagus irregularis]|nr:unnamed protein product [Rhizophagus irregularis]
MKFLIFFVALLIVNVNAKLTCEERFGVSLCNECQNEVWDYGRDPLGCGFFSSLFSEIEYSSFFLKYNLTVYNEIVKNSCSADFSCSYDEAQILRYLIILLSPLTLLYFPIILPYLNIILYVIKTSSGELCGIEVIKPLVDWLSKKFLKEMYNFHIINNTFIRKMGTRIQVPMELMGHCGECGKNMIKEYKTWMDKFAVPDVILKNVFDNDLEALQGRFSCPLIF